MTAAQHPAPPSTLSELSLRAADLRNTVILLYLMPRDALARVPDAAIERIEAEIALIASTSDAVLDEARTDLLRRRFAGRRALAEPRRLLAAALRKRERAQLCAAWREYEGAA